MTERQPRAARVVPALLVALLAVVALLGVARAGAAPAGNQHPAERAVLLAVPVAADLVGSVREPHPGTPRVIRAGLVDPSPATGFLFVGPRLGWWLRPGWTALVRAAAGIVALQGRAPPVAAVHTRVSEAH